MSLNWVRGSLTWVSYVGKRVSYVDRQCPFPAVQRSSDPAGGFQTRTLRGKLLRMVSWLWLWLSLSHKEVSYVRKEVAYVRKGVAYVRKEVSYVRKGGLLVVA